MKRQSLVFLVLLVLLTITAAKVSATTIEVCPSGCAYSTIQSAINIAVNGDTVQVDDGIYTENINFLGKTITVASVNGPDVTIIDGNANGSVIMFASGEGAGSVLDGFSIRNGFTDYGGGILCDGASPTITNCIIANNVASNSGGGIACGENSSPVISNCIVVSNSASDSGGGIAGDYSASAPTITGCTIRNNTAYWGGGAAIHNGAYIDCTISSNLADLGGGIACFDNSPPTITNCAIRNNRTEGAYKYGGGIYCDVASSPPITNCTISSNTAMLGGGIYCNDNSSPIITGCVVKGNSADKGGGIYYSFSSPIVEKCIVRNNAATGTYGNGGGIYCYQSASKIVNCVISSNTAHGAAGIRSYFSTIAIINCTIVNNGNGGVQAAPMSESTTISNSIIWSNLSYSISTDPSSPITIDYSDIQGGWTGNGTGNIDTDPLFIGDGNYHLTAGSPCIDVGTSTGAPADDIDGDARPYDVPSTPNNPSAYDMGADEYTLVCPDADGDGYTDESCGGDDCNDTDPAINPGATEVCDNKDNDCDGQVDEGCECVPGDTQSCNTGLLGICAVGTKTCSEAANWGNCVQDNQATPEICDGTDNDCDGQVNEGLLTDTYYADTDSDGFGDPNINTEYCTQPSGYVTDNTDCDDNNNAVYPGATEVCDGLDSDCNPATADGADEAWLGAACDGFDSDLCEEGTYICSNNAQTCNDATGDNLEICDGTDNDCNPATADGYDESWLGTACDGNDQDECEEGVYECSGGSMNCNDATGDDVEVCDEVDNDCDGQVDEGCNEADGDVNGDGNITPQDALMGFQHYLGMIQLDASQLSHCDVNEDGSITPADALCIFQKYLGLPSCLD